MKQLLPHQSITIKGDRPSVELLQILQQMVNEWHILQAQMEAIAAVTITAGGATIDIKARDAIQAVIDAAGA